MKYLILILFCIFVQTDSTKVDTVKVQSIDIQQKFDNTNNKLDSIIAILKDTINKKH